MPVTPTYPGVYIEELPSGVHTIVGVATSITAFLGRTLKGPANMGVTLTSYGDFERSFGGLDRQYPVSYAVFDFFAHGGSQAVVVRLFYGRDAKAAQEVAKVAADSSEPPPLGGAGGSGGGHRRGMSGKLQRASRPARCPAYRPGRYQDLPSYQPNLDSPHCPSNRDTWTRRGTGRA